MGRKIFVGNLSFDTTSADLEALFAEVGSCESVSVVTDRATGRSRGFGFQPYFETGFPHGKDQFISSAATSWAAIALTYVVQQPRLAALDLRK